MNNRIRNSWWLLVFFTLSTGMADSGEEKKQKVSLENKNICVYVIGEKDSMLVKDLSPYLKTVFPQKIKSAEMNTDLGFAYNPQRKQYNSSTILEKLKTIKEKECEHLLAIVGVDLFVPELNFVFGEADFQAKVAVISTVRLKQGFYGLSESGYIGTENKQLFLERVAKEAVHELGHTYGLPHCANRKCVMHFSNSLWDTDFKFYFFCENCKEKLQSVER